MSTQPPTDRHTMPWKTIIDYGLSIFFLVVAVYYQNDNAKKQEQTIDRIQTEMKKIENDLKNCQIENAILKSQIQTQYEQHKQKVRR